LRSTAGSDGPRRGQELLPKRCVRGDGVAVSYFSEPPFRRRPIGCDLPPASARPSTDAARGNLDGVCNSWPRVPVRSRSVFDARRISMAKKAPVSARLEDADAARATCLVGNHS